MLARLFCGYVTMHALVQMYQDTGLHMSHLESGSFIWGVASTMLHLHSCSPMALGSGLVANVTLPIMYWMASRKPVFVH
jgi:hypothetical protein